MAEMCGHLLHPLHCLPPSRSPQDRSNWDLTRRISMSFPSEVLGRLNRVDLSGFFPGNSLCVRVFPPSLCIIAGNLVLVRPLREARAWLV